MSAFRFSIRQILIALVLISVSRPMAGCGDIIPTSPYARSLATTESTVGVLYLAVLISQLVTLHLAHQRTAVN